MENIPEHFAPFEREENKAIERISAREELEKIIKFSSDEMPKNEKRPQDIILAAKDYLERISAIDSDRSKNLSELIKRAEREAYKKRLSEVGPITEVQNQKGKKRVFRKHP